MTLYLPKNDTPENLGRSTTLIIGNMGVGKTLLASTWPAPFFLDVEGGAGSVRCPRQKLPLGTGLMGAIKGEIGRLKTYPFKTGAIQHPQGFPIETVVVDSLDAIQANEKTYTILKNKPHLERSDWDTLYNLLLAFLLSLLELPVHIVLIGHAEQADSDGGPASQGLALQGSMKADLLFWLDYVLHVIAHDDGRRSVLPQSARLRGVEYLGKDRHSTFIPLIGKGPGIDLPLVNDRPAGIIADRIRGRHRL